LAVLLGRAPGDLQVQSPRMIPDLPPLPQTGILADWLRRRPDLRAAELRVQAADRRVAAAIADQFPRLSLTVRAETSAEHVRDLFDNWLAGLAANLAAPLFDAGLRRAEIERTRAVVREQLNAYGQTVLTSLSDVENALSQEAQQAKLLVSLRRQLDLSNQSTVQTRENYIRGTMDFIRYLTTLLAHQRLERSYLQAKRQLVEFRIDLYRALGGRWELPAPDLSEDVEGVSRGEPPPGSTVCAQDPPRVARVQ
jgi:outer membrane protein TolC